MFLHTFYVLLREEHQKVIILRDIQEFSYEDIANMISLEKERSIDVIITRLRKKIENNPKNPKYLQTIRGSGYVLWVE